MTAAFTEMAERERELGLERYSILRPHLEEGVALTQVARQQKRYLRTLQRWVKRYHADGLAGLIRK